jgi:hypothetical protein
VSAHVLGENRSRCSDAAGRYVAKDVSTRHFHFLSNDQDYSAPTARINLAQDCRVRA